MRRAGQPGDLKHAREAAAAEALGLHRRLNLGIPDGAVRDTDANRALVVGVLRQLRPQVVIAPPFEDHHPDHMGTADLVRQSFYLSSIRKFHPELQPWKPKALLHHWGSRPFSPQVVVDVSPVFEQRMRAVRCYESQFGARQESGFPLRISSQNFLASIEATLKYFGSLIGVAYGEPYRSELPLPAGDLVGLFGVEPWKDR